MISYEMPLAPGWHLAGKQIPVQISAPSNAAYCGGPRHGAPQVAAVIFACYAGVRGRGSVGRVVRTRRAVTAGLERDASQVEDSMKLLGIQAGATMDDLRAAYRLKTKQVHPDISEAQGLDPKVAAEKFIELQSAYAQLRKILKETALPKLETGPDSWNGRFTWEMSSEQVLALRNEQSQQFVRDTVWFSLIWGARKWKWELEGTLRDKPAFPPRIAPPELLMRLFLKLMDEAIRRKLRIHWATLNNNLLMINELKAGRTERHVLLDKMEEAKKKDGEESIRYVALSERYKYITKNEEDITVDKDGKDWSAVDAQVAHLLAMPYAKLNAGKPSRRKLSRGGAWIAE